jgi:uncharacterized DUF497 family protein
MEILSMKFNWDENKNKKNKQKHKISFELAKQVFDDRHLLSWLDGEYENEERWINLGCIDGLVVIIVVHTFRRYRNEQEIIRIISARKSTKKEYEIYFKCRK